MNILVILFSLTVWFVSSLTWIQKEHMMPPPLTPSLQDSSEKEGVRKRPIRGSRQGIRDFRLDTSRDSLGEDNELPLEFVEHVMAVAKEVDPALAAYLKQMCVEDPEGFDKVIRRQGRRLVPLIRLRDSDPTLFELQLGQLKTDAEIIQVSQVLKEAGADDDDFLARIAELKALIHAKTRLSVEIKLLQIDRIQTHLLKLQEEVAEMNADIDSIVDSRVSQLVETMNEKSVKNNKD